MGDKLGQLQGHEQFALLVTNSTLLSHLKMVEKSSPNKDHILSGKIDQLLKCHDQIRQNLIKHESLLKEHLFIASLCDLSVSEEGITEVFEHSEL